MLLRGTLEAVGGGQYLVAQQGMQVGMGSKEVGHGLGGLKGTVTGQEIAAPVGGEEDVACALQLGQQGEGWLDVVYGLPAAHGMIEIVEQGERPRLDATVVRLSQRGKEGITLSG